MRRSIILLGLIIPLVIAAVRASTKPLFINSYSFLQMQNMESMEIVVLRVIQLVVLFTILLIAFKEHNIPIDSFMVLIVSPIILTTLVVGSVSLELGILAAIVMTLWNKPLPVAIVSAIFPIIHPIGILLSILVLVGLAGRKKWISSLILLVAIVGITYFTPFRLTFDPTTHLTISSTIFIQLLAITGLIAVWNKKTFNYLTIAVILLLSGFMIGEFAIIGSIAAAILAGFAVNMLRTREWVVDSIRNISILLVMCGLLFTVASTASETIDANPSEKLLGAVKFTKQAANTNEVFTLIEHRDMFRWYGVDATSRNSKEILSSRNLDKIINSIPPYIVLHEDDKADNLRFLIANTNNFKLVYDDEYQVWLFLRK